MRDVLRVGVASIVVVLAPMRAVAEEPSISVGFHFLRGPRTPAVTIPSSPMPLARATT